MLTSVSADTPATRKICGFCAHSARRSICWKKFVCTSFGTKPDYSGFERSSRTPRNHNEHVDILQQIQRKMTVSEANILQKRWGIRYSKLVKLPYFDIVCFHVIDPMHNLLLGTAKKRCQFGRRKR